MNVHTSDDLRQMQSLPLEAKILMSKQRIRQWYDYWNGMVYVSFSGGKDSTVLKHLVEHTPGVYDVPSLFVNTGLEYPEIQRFAMSQPNVTTVRPEMRFDEVIKKYGYPVISKEVSEVIYSVRHSVPGETKTTRMKRLNGELLDKDGNKSRFNCDNWKFVLDAPFEVANHCCSVMKKRPAKKYAKETGRKPFIGTLASESRLRYQKWLQHGCNAFEKGNPSSQPLSFWTEQDILLYLKKYNVPYCSVYGDIVTVDAEGNEYDMPTEYMEALVAADAIPQLKTTGCGRTGCIFCMFGCHLEKEPNRFQRLKETHPRQYKYCIGGGEMVDGKWQPSKDGLGLGKVLDYIGVDYR